MRSRQTLALIGLASVLACSRSEDVTAPQPLGPQALSTDGIAQVLGPDTLPNGPTIVDFDGLPVSGSSCQMPSQPQISNPLTLHGVTFEDPACLRSGFCSSPTCPVAKIVLALNQGGTISLAAPNRGVMLQIEGVGDTPYVVEFKDRRGRTLNVGQVGKPFGTQFTGVTSVSGIERVRVVRTGPTPSCPEPSCGPLVIARVFALNRLPG